MELFICKTCGVQYPPSEVPPSECKICNEERQYVDPNGQEWTTLSEMAGEGFQNEIKEDETNLYSLHTTPDFAIGQTAYLVQTNGFNLLWDCITYLDNETKNKMNQLGRIDAIALSHPHYYSTQVEWAEAFDVPLYIHEDDKEWVVRPSHHVHFWSGDSLELANGLTLHRLGGHYKGGAVLHWPDGDGGKGILLTGDVIQVVADRRWVSFMYSYPNLIPLPPATVERIAGQVKPLPFNRLYNAFHRIVQTDAANAVQRSAERYVAAIRGEHFTT